MPCLDSVVSVRKSLAWEAVVPSLFAGIRGRRLAPWEGKQNEPRVSASRQSGEQLGVAFVHGKDPRAFSQLCFGIFHGEIAGQVVAGMAKAEEVRVEAMIRVSSAESRAAEAPF